MPVNPLFLSWFCFPSCHSCLPALLGFRFHIYHFFRKFYVVIFESVISPLSFYTLSSISSPLPFFRRLQSLSQVLLDYLHSGCCPLSCITIPGLLFFTENSHWFPVPSQGLICAAEHYDLPDLIQACFHHAKQFIRTEIACQVRPCSTVPQSRFILRCWLLWKAITGATAPQVSLSTWSLLS